ncbi:MAG: hypothetical protein IIV99_06420 [Oscillospiraceae bacterium]|nr:hypothetical protein [Oscillospiraceae bacterium]
MKKLILLLLTVVFCFAGCSGKEIPSYNLAICDETLEQLSTYLSQQETESFKTESCDFSAETLAQKAQEIADSKDKINCITLFGDVGEETALLFVETAKEKDIPVVFAFDDTSNDVLSGYDKAVCIKTNYTHTAEMSAIKIKELWADGHIADSDENMIMSFAGITDDSDATREYYNALVKNIEIYGVPIQHNGTVLPNSINEKESWDAFMADNEFVIVCHSFMHTALSEYTTESGKKEFLIFDTTDDDSTRKLDFAVNCYISFEDYKQAVDEVVANFEQRTFILNNLSYPYIDKTIYIPAEIKD